MESKNNYIVVDSNVWIGFRHTNDSSHEAAVKAMKQIEMQGQYIIITNFIIQEVFTVLSNKEDQALAIQFYEYILAHTMIRNFDIDRIMLKYIINFIKRETLSKSLGLVDYSILFLKSEFQMEILSFDQDLLKVARNV